MLHRLYSRKLKVDLDHIVGIYQQVTTSKQQLSLIADEIKQFESRLSSLTTDLQAQIQFIKIQKWDSGKYYSSCF